VDVVFDSETEVFGRQPFQTERGVVDVPMQLATPLEHPGAGKIHAPPRTECMAPADLQQRGPGADAGAFIQSFRAVIQRGMPLECRRHTVMARSQAQADHVVRITEPPAPGQAAESEVELAVQTCINTVFGTLPIETTIPRARVASLVAVVIERQPLMIT